MRWRGAPPIVGPCLESGEDRLSEVAGTPPRPLIVAAIVVLCLAIGAAYAVQARALRARFLMTPADLIPQDVQLLRYAMARGASGYRKSCAACHGDHLQGDSSLGIPNLADKDWLYGSGRVSEIERVILYGIRSGNSKGWDLAHMPAFATPRPYDQYAMEPLSPNEIDDVTTYLLSFQQRQQDAAAVDRGSRIFHDAAKGVCGDCHGVDAKGDSAIGAPDLTDTIWLRGEGDRASIEDTIAHGLAGRCPGWSAKLAPVAIRSIAVYVHSMATQAAARAHEGHT